MPVIGPRPLPGWQSVRRFEWGALAHPATEAYDAAFAWLERVGYFAA